MLRRTRSGLPAPIAEFIENVCQKKVRHTSLRTPTLLVPIDSGNGRSQITRAITDMLYNAKAQNFSSRDHFLDFTFNGKAANVDEVDAEIQTVSEYANNYKGVVSFGLDALVPHLTEPAGEKLFRLVNKVKKDSTVIIFVPADCTQRNLDLISERVSVKLFSPITYGADDFARMFYDFLPAEIRSTGSFETHKGNIKAYIELKIPKMSIRVVKEAAEAIIFDDAARAKLFSDPGKPKESEDKSR